MANPQLEKAKSYYHDGQLRIEKFPQCYDHSYNNFSMGYVVALFSAIKGIPISGVTNCTFRETGEEEAQPDLAFYLGNHAEIIPPDTSLVNLDVYPSPDLVIEIVKTSLSDDLGSKRRLYERLRVAEYWVVNVRRASLMALAIADGGSKPIAQSQVLPPLHLMLLEEALHRGRQTGRSLLYAWLITQIQTLGN